MQTISEQARERRFQFTYYTRRVGVDHAPTILESTKVLHNQMTAASRVNTSYSV